MESQNVPTWIMNSRGIKSCWPKDVAEKRVSQNVGWKFCEPEYVPENKEYPMSTQMTEAGKSRRLGINSSKTEAMSATLATQTDSELRAKAKELGVKQSHLKGIEKIAREI